MPSDAPAPPHRLSRNGRYLVWLASDTASGLSNALASFAIPLLALVVTDDPAQAGAIGAAGMAARVVTTLAGGVIADRHRRLRLMLVGAVAGLVLAVAFAALAWSDALTFSTLLAVNTLITVRSGLFGAAGESALKELVPAEAIGRAQAANQGRDALLSLVGGPLGGVLLAAGGWLVGAAMTLCQLVAAATAWALRRGRWAGMAPAGEQQPTPDARSSALREARDGIAWLLARRDLRDVLLVTTVVNLGFTAGTTAVIYALQQDGRSPATIGWVAAGLGAAMLVGAAFGPALVSRVRAGALLVGGLVAATGGVLALAFVDDPIAIVGVLGLAVLGIPALNAGLLGYFTVATPSRLLGRANSDRGHAARTAHRRARTLLVRA
ncbi:MFS transporter [Microbacterium betulae]|uniref:MFS transporter n=1 Tax=Microbacterium betulae TaxID=2981139 RepID=A0AA97FIA9_9MICO|nr:MFS transporter [Microbacterium sp. AB]WOF23208.1 MFS transporter [Microbacterium sp. AB]